MPVNGVRYSQIQHWFRTLQNWEAFKALEVDVHAVTPASQAPYGCEVSVGLYEEGHRGQELWNNSRWYSFKAQDWQTISIPLAPISPDVSSDGWPPEGLEELPGFAVPTWWRQQKGTGDGDLDLGKIVGVQIQVMVTEENAIEHNASRCEIAIDSIRLH